MKIAITLRDDLDEGQLWYGSGIAQNIKFYYDLFEVMGYEVVMMVGKEISLDVNGKQYQMITRQRAVDEAVKFDIIIEAGTTISLHDKALLRSACDAKIIGLRCGHQYGIAAEGLFVKKELQENLFVGGQDQMWLLPHYAKQAQMLSVIHDCPVSVVPYIWQPDFIKKRFIDHGRIEKPNIYVMEPNISVAKNALLPMVIINRLFKVAPDSFNKAIIFNSESFYGKQYFLYNFVNNLEVLQAHHDKVFFDKRHPIDIIFDAPHILLGHQIDNGLNNLYKEAFYMGIPLVHNAQEYQNVGYYYPEFDVDKAVEQILLAIETHKPHDIEKNEVLLERSSIYNENVKKQYAKLLQTVLDS